MHLRLTKKPKILLSLGIIYFLTSIVSLLQAQGSIIDDSTKQVYGYNSTGYLLERNYLRNDTALRQLDTLIENFRFVNKVFENKWLIQDLGNDGTASKPYLPALPSTIAVQNGFNAFHLYAPNADSIKYFNTRSPYTKMFYTQNTRGLLKLGFTHSQNINPLLNFALDCNRLTSSKQFSAANSEDRLVDHWDVSFSSNYNSPNRKYSLLAAFINFNHKQNEQGGIDIDENYQVNTNLINKDYNSFYTERLSGVNSTERWNDLHVYQQFLLSSGFQLFNTFDYQRHKNFYNDNDFETNYSPFVYGDTLSLDSLNTYYSFQVIQNQTGLKGVYKGFRYILGVQPRVTINRSILSSDFNNKSNFELIGKLNLSYDFADSSSFINAKAELGTVGYLLKADAFYKGFVLGFYRSDRPVDLLFQQFSSPLVNWVNNYSNTRITNFDVRLPLKIKNFAFEGGLKFMTLNNYLYFDEFQKPQQSQTEAITNVDFKVAYTSSWFKFEQQLFLNGNSNNVIFAIPALSSNTNIEFKINYAKVLDIYLGTDIYYRSKYKANAYSPLLRSFYVQQQSDVWGLPVANVYTKFLVKKVKIALVYSYLNQGLLSSGFFTTPGYLGLRRAFNVQVNWPLFD